MTYEQMKFAIEQIRKFSNQKQNPKYEAVSFLVHKTLNYFNCYCFNESDIKIDDGGDNITESDMIADCNLFIFQLEGMLAADKNYPIIRDILNDIDKYKKRKSDESIKTAIKEIYFSYSGRIKFDKVVEKIIIDDTKDILHLNNGGFDETVLYGMLRNLEDYANEVCSNKSKSVYKEKELKQPTQITINNSNNFNANVSIDVAIKNSYEKLEEACLSTEQEQLVRDKISEIEKTIKSKGNKSSIWKKLGSTLKWVAEQGIQVAGIIVPLIAKALSN